VKTTVQKVYSVVEGQSFTWSEVQSILDQGYTKWKFPNGRTFPIRKGGAPSIGEQLQRLGQAGALDEYQWVAIMPVGWKPVRTH